MDVIELIKDDRDNSYLPKLLENDYFPTVSVVTPTYNRHHLIDMAIFNWQNFIYPEDKIEWIILDDSTRDSIKITKKKIPKDDKRIKYYTCKKIHTIGKKRNKVNELATGDIIVHMDDDDYYTPDSIINRVRALLTYSKQCVGSTSINCINLLDNTCFKTSGGVRGNTIITGESSLCYYKKFWEEQKYDEETTNEECKEFLENRIKDYIDLHSAFVTILITHSQNMSDRVIINSVNRYNFFNELPVAVVNLLEKIQLRIHESLEGVSEGKDFIRQNYGKSYDQVLQKLEKLPDYIKSTSLMSNYIEDIQPVEDIKNDSVIVIFFPGMYYRTFECISKENINYKLLHIIEYLNDYYSGKSIRLYAWTYKKFTINNVDIIPWYYFNKKLSADTTIMIDEYSHITTITSQKNNTIVYLNLSCKNYFADSSFLEHIHRYDTFNDHVIDKTIPTNMLQFYYLGTGEELDNNKLFTEYHYNEAFKNYKEIHSYNYSHFDKKYNILQDDDMNCEFFVLRCLNIPLMCYLIKLGVKYLRIDEDDLKDFGVLSVYDKLPNDYFRNLEEKLKTVIKII